MLILGIETSCDETSAAVVENGRKILSNIILSQVNKHKIFGGVVPEIAARLHLESIMYVIKEALSVARVGPRDISALAVVYGPGLCGSLLIGVTVAKTMAYSLEIPLIKINHLQAHIYSAALCYKEINLPAIALVVSGGHTCLAEVNAFDDYKLLGETLDDAVGEAYDKVGKMLNLGYPGGPPIEAEAKYAKENNIKPVKFPRPYLFNRPYDFSFSGLKTAVLHYIRKHKNYQLPAVALGFQETVTDVLVKKTINAAEKLKIKAIILAGGVAANCILQERFKAETRKREINFYYPKDITLCTDNAAMVAGLAYRQYNTKKDIYFDVEPNLSLED